MTAKLLETRRAAWKPAHAFYYHGGVLRPCPYVGPEMKTPVVEVVLYLPIGMPHNVPQLDAGLEAALGARYSHYSILGFSTECEANPSLYTSKGMDDL